MTNINNTNQKVTLHDSIDINYDQLYYLTYGYSDILYYHEVYEIDEYISTLPKGQAVIYIADDDTLTFGKNSISGAFEELITVTVSLICNK